MRTYIEFNSQKRALADNPFDINFYKFLSNSLFGKTMERPENKSIVKLVNNIESYQKHVSKLNFKQAKIIHEHLVGLELKHPVFVIDKPFYIGAIILEIAKYFMYKFHYDVMKVHFEDRMRLLYTDTDSFIYEIKSGDVYKELEGLKKHFDFSNYPISHPSYDVINKKVPGRFKDECASKPIEAFAGLRSKMYCLKLGEGEKEIRAAKGVKKNVIEQQLRFENYKQCLFKSQQMEHAFKTIKSEQHKVFTSHQSKISLSPFDDKRWLKDAVSSYAYGNVNILDSITQTKTTYPP